jgi:hypothetical protein
LELHRREGLPTRQEVFVSFVSFGSSGCPWAPRELIQTMHA